MPDNIGYTPGSGATVAADDIGGVLFQRIKVVHGADGTNDGDVSATNPFPVSVPVAVSGTIMSLTTAATGSNWTTFSSQACNCLDVLNNSSVAIEYRRGGAGNTMQILSGTSRLIVGIANANEVGIRRVDQSNTQITLPAEAIVA